MPSQESWISDGTPAAEPVTIETPVVAEPVVEAAATPARGADGKFVAASPVPETPVTPTPALEASTVAAPVPGASAQAVQDFIEARLATGEPFQIPKGVQLPMKRHGQVEYEPIETAITERMLERDYRIKTTEAQRIKREAESERSAVAAESARIGAREQWLKEQEAQMVEARKDPAAWEAYQQMMELYQTNTRFRQTMDDALAKRETDAENEVYRERDRATAIQDGKTIAMEWITEIGAEFPNADPKRIATLYGQALSAGQAQLHPDAVRAIYRGEAESLAQSTGPLQKQLAELTAQVAALTAAKAAEKHNAITDHALKRAAAPPVATNGLPPVSSGTGAIKRFPQNELPDRNSDWARQR